MFNAINQGSDAKLMVKHQIVYGRGNLNKVFTSGQVAGPCFCCQLEDGEQVVGLMQQEEIEPSDHVHFPESGMYGPFGKIGAGKGKHTGREFLAYGHQVMDDLMAGFAQVVVEKRIGFGGVNGKPDAVGVEHFPDAPDEHVLVGFEVHDIFEDGPFTRHNGHADL